MLGFELHMDGQLAGKPLCIAELSIDLMIKRIVSLRNYTNLL